MPWQELEVELGAREAESLGEALLEQGALAVSLEDADAGGASECAQYAEPGAAPPAPWSRNRLTALLAPESDVVAKLERAAHAAGLAPPALRATRRVADEDWVRRVQSQFGALRASNRLWVVPSWCEPPPEADVLMLRLDPGTAFGTGSHASTRLALAWLESTLCGGERLLDYGCGSGILALAAARFGAADIVAVDLDPQALEAASANALANGIVLQVTAPQDMPLCAYDVIVANILAQPLIALAPRFASLARPGARIALSGILDHQANEVIAAYAPDFQLQRTSAEEAWALLAGTRR